MQIYGNKSIIVEYVNDFLLKGSKRCVKNPNGGNPLLITRIASYLIVL